MMDLGNFELRRSLHPVHYVYLFHSLGSTHMADYANSYDHYDTILCAGPHHLREIRRREELREAAGQAAGRARLRAARDSCSPSATERPARAAAGPPRCSIAPTWGEQSLLNVCGERLVEILLAAGYRVILRPHYMTARTSPELVARLVRRFGVHPRFEYDGPHGRDGVAVSAPISWCATGRRWRSSGGSASRSRRCSSTCPPRVRNPEWRALGLEPLEASIRTEIGALLDPARLDEAPAPDREAARGSGAVPGHARPSLRARSVFNPGRSAEVAAAEIARLADERAGERRRDAVSRLAPAARARAPARSGRGARRHTGRCRVVRSETLRARVRAGERAAARAGRRARPRATRRATTSAFGTPSGSAAGPDRQSPATPTLAARIAALAYRVERRDEAERSCSTFVSEPLADGVALRQTWRIPPRGYETHARGRLEGRGRRRVRRRASARARAGRLEARSSPAGVRLRGPLGGGLAVQLDGGWSGARNRFWALLVRSDAPARGRAGVPHLLGPDRARPAARGRSRARRRCCSRTSGSGCAGSRSACCSCSTRCARWSGTRASRSCCSRRA